MLTDDGLCIEVAVVWSRRCSAQALNPQKSKADPTESGPQLAERVIEVFLNLSPIA